MHDHSFEYIAVLNYLYPHIQAAAAGPNYEDIVWNDESEIIPKQELHDNYLTMRKHLLYEAATNEMNRRIDEVGVVFKGHPFGTDINSRVNLAGAIMGITALGRTVPPNFTWRSSDDTSVSMSQEELMAFGGLVVDFTFAIHHALWAKKEMIFNPAVDSIEALEALDIIDGGWPPPDMVFPPPEDPEDEEPPEDNPPEEPPVDEPPADEPPADEEPPVDEPPADNPPDEPPADPENPTSP